MAEFITETIIPGTYIEVRAEGLLSVGAIPTGNVGIIGTAEMGNGRVQILSSFDEGRAKFGEPGTWDPVDENGFEGNLTLVRALKLLFDNGARTVYALRVMDETAAVPAEYDVRNDGNTSLLALKAKTSGTWGNRLQVRVEEGENQELITNELVTRDNGSYRLSAETVAEPAEADASIGNILVRENGLLKRYQLKQSAPTSEVVQINPADRSLSFAQMPSAEAEVRASYQVPWESIRKITLKYGNVQEVYIIPSVSYFAQLINDERKPSKLVTALEQNGNGLPRPTERFESFANGENGPVAIGHYKQALDKLVDHNVQIVVSAGGRFSLMKSALLGHVEKTENLSKERMVVVGADSDEVEKALENANEVADKRIILTAPGLKQSDPQSGRLQQLPPYFTAAAVAGKLSSVSPHISLTNKSLAGIDDISLEYNYGQMKSLVDNRILALQKKRGLRIVKGITTHDEAFKQISVRRIIDYIKEGTRRGANQYIGKLNNARVRGALHTTLNGFLTDMVTREFLTGYKLEVFADRAMEIRGEVQVTMELNPTFSIDVIRVIMNLS